MYKLVKPDGTDFYSGTINYAENVGKIIRVVDCDPPEAGDCGRGLHSCKNPNDCFVGAQIPCRAFKVEPIDTIVCDKYKTRSQALKIISEVIDLNTLFGWKYDEVNNPIHPLKLIAPQVSETHILLLKKWSVVWNSVGSSVWDSVRKSVRISVFNPVRYSVINSVGNSVYNSVGSVVWNSVGDSIWAYTGSLFPNIKIWNYIKHEKGTYPFQSAVDLWRAGFVPSFDGVTWRLHAGEKADVVWEGIIT